MDRDKVPDYSKSGSGSGRRRTLVEIAALGASRAVAPVAAVPICAALVDIAAVAFYPIEKFAAFAIVPDTTRRPHRIDSIGLSSLRDDGGTDTDGKDA